LLAAISPINRSIEAPARRADKAGVSASSPLRPTLSPARSHLAAISPRIIRELRLGRLSIAQRRSVLMRVDGPPEAGFHGCLVPRTSAALIRGVCRASLMAAEVQVRRRDNPTCHAGDWVLTHWPAAAMPKLEGRIALEGSLQPGAPGLQGPRVLSAAYSLSRATCN
jgi:hypothetical protein